MLPSAFLPFMFWVLHYVPEPFLFLLLHSPCLLEEVLPDSVGASMKTSDSEYFNVLQSTINDRNIT